MTFYAILQIVYFLSPYFGNIFNFPSLFFFVQQNNKSQNTYFVFHFFLSALTHVCVCIRMCTYAYDCWCLRRPVHKHSGDSDECVRADNHFKLKSFDSMPCCSFLLDIFNRPICFLFFQQIIYYISKDFFGYLIASLFLRKSI